MRFGIVRNLVAHARSERECSAVLQLRVKLAFNAQEHVALHAPVIGDIARRVLDHPDADRSERPRAPVRAAALARMFGGFDGGPLGDAERNTGHFHSGFPS